MTRPADSVSLPDHRRRWGSRRWFFVAGATAGFALGLAAKGVAHDAAPVLAGADIVLARGKVQQGGTPPAASALRVVTRTPSAERPAGSSPLPTFREVARAAAAITVSITGNGNYGAGFVVDDKFILTCLHVIEDMKRIDVSLAGGPPLEARVVDRDAELDIALLTADLSQPIHARLGSISTVEMGDPVFSMGTPRQLGFSLASGLVSFVGRPYSGVFYLQTDIPTNPGSSGGPLLDAEGRVIGVASFILRDSQGLAFALPIDYAVRRFRAQLGEQLTPDGLERWLAERAAVGSNHLAATRSSR